jgi:hypothetical protein
VRREITANPKKAAVLALLLLVAVVFWAPLVTKWMGKDDASAMAANTSENPTPTTTSTPTNGPVPAPADTMTKTIHWNHVLTAIRDDSRMQPYTRVEGERDPFSPAASKLAAQNQAQKAAVEVAPEITPEQAGIVLHSTVVGAQIKTALINGRAYHEDQNVLAANGRDRFVVVEIRENAVVLSRHGQLYDVKMKAVEVAAGDE